MNDAHSDSNTEAANPYAAPSAGAEEVTTRFELDEDQRKVIMTTATLMIVAGIVQVLPTLVELVLEGISVESVVLTAIFGVVPVFVTIAGFSLRSAAEKGSLEALLSGFRQLHVAFLVKGVALILVIAFFLIGIAAMFLGVGLDFFRMFN